MKYQITTKTREQIDADFTATFKDIEPSGTVTAEMWLEPYREAILAQRERGLTWEQIAAGMRGPRINEKVSARMLMSVFGGKAGRKSRRKAAKRKPRSPKKPKAQPKPPISAPPPAVDAEPPKQAAAASALPTQSQTLFDRLAPKIIRMGFTDDVAINELVEGYVKENRGAPSEASDAFAEAAMAQFDAMTYETAQSRYGIKRADWDDWRKEWCELRETAV